MNRIDMLKHNDEKSLVLYIMAGDPNLKTTEELLYLMSDEGVSLIEIGVPFSDPVADGTTIQAAGERALKNNITIASTLSMIKRVRNKVTIPMVIMTYYNLIYSYGPEKFVDDCLKNGIDGAIIPDLPFDEEMPFYNYAKNKGFYLIYLVSPANTVERAKKIVEKSLGFVYYILLKGVTGSRQKPAYDLKVMKIIRKITDKPILGGFGISTPDQAAEVSEFTDGVIIGSAFVELINKYSKNRVKLKAEAKRFIKQFKARL
jgi:tryptophan synthase alpha chain